MPLRYHDYYLYLYLLETPSSNVREVQELVSGPRRRAMVQGYQSSSLVMLSFTRPPNVHRLLGCSRPRGVSPFAPSRPRYYFVNQPKPPQPHSHHVASCCIPTSCCFTRPCAWGRGIHISKQAGFWTLRVWWGFGSQVKLIRLKQKVEAQVYVVDRTLVTQNTGGRA